jgi:hypothetical protein
MKQVTALKLACVGAFVATLGVGCASTGYAKNDADMSDEDQAVGVSASASVGTDSSVSVSSDANASTEKTTTVSNEGQTTTTTVTTTNTGEHPIIVDEGEARVTVSALSMSPETRASWVSRFPFYDRNYRTIDIYNFAVADDTDVEMSTTMEGEPQFTSDLPPGTVFVEAAGGGEVRTGRIIQHSPNPTR